MLSRLGALACHRGYWLALIVFALTLLGAALYYQHVLNEWPCVLCIQVRVILVLLLFVAIPALLFKPQGKACLLSQTLVVLLTYSMLNRSWRLFGTEHGLIEGDCSVTLGLPDWLAVDQWFPNIFGVWSSCGYTPELILGITMADMLLVLSAAWLLLCVLMLIALIRGHFSAR